MQGLFRASRRLDGRPYAANAKLSRHQLITLTQKGRAVYRYRLSNIQCNDGTQIALGDLTVIIGPNNAGKSRALRDIALLTCAQTETSGKVVVEVQQDMPPSLAEFFSSYPQLRPDESSTGFVTNAMEPTLIGVKAVSWGSPLSNVEHNWDQMLRTGTPRSNLNIVLGARLTTHLTTDTRLTLLNSGSPVSSPKPETVLQQLYSAGTQKEDELRAAVKSTFNVELALDFTIPAVLCMRVAETLGSIPPDPRDALPVMQKFERLDDQGDGLRSFTSVAAALLVMDRPVCLIDEPEAFLHPPQAFALGRFIAAHSGPKRQLIVATHSADVLRGILSVKNSASVLRIDRAGTKNSFRQLAPERLLEMARDSLLATHRVIDGLFASAAVVTEADSDARFYETLLSKVRPDSDVHFVSADNKQTVEKVAALYRQLGVRAVGIVDIDALNNADEFGKMVASLGLDCSAAEQAIESQKEIAKSVTGRTSIDKAQLLIDALTAAKEKIMTALHGSEPASIDKAINAADGTIRKAIEDGKPWAKIKREGTDAFSEDAKAAFQRVYSLCASRGLFINPYGELESMLTDVGLNYTADKRAWFQQAIVLASNLGATGNGRALTFARELAAALFDQEPPT